MKEFTIKMQDVINKMFGQAPKTLLGNDIGLAAVLAIIASYSRSAIEAVFLFTFWLVGHAKFS